NGQSVVGAAGERQRQTEVGGIEHRLAGLQESYRLTILAERDLDQRELEDDLRLVRIDRQRILIGLLGGPEAAAGAISVAEEGPEAGIIGRSCDRLFGEADRG